MDRPGPLSVRNTTLGIYIQVPFCQTKCTYCNFHTGAFSRSLYSPYVDAVCKEIENTGTHYGPAGQSLLEPLAGLTVDTVYVGGGTPSLLEPSGLARVLDSVRTSFEAEFDEVTLEADPETISAEKARAWREAGYNRISLGAQSFHDKELKAAGRMHRASDISGADRYLREAGFSNLSYDLIIGLPHQTADSWKQSVERLLELAPEHISIYMLEVDDGSRLGREILAGGPRYGAGAVRSDDELADSYDRAREWLTAAGYRHYEISNWAKPGYESRHNLKYWRREPYLGFGAGAHSFNGRERWANVHDPAEYAAAIGRTCAPIERRELLTEEQVLQETCFLGLRQTSGLDLEDIGSGPRAKMQPQVEKLLGEGFVRFEGRFLQIPPEHWSIANEVLVELLR
jgi:oxygen-independent coproporphyrinogen III oxidase